MLRSQPSQLGFQVRTLNTALKWQPGHEAIADFALQARKAMDGQLTEAQLKEIA